MPQRLAKDALSRLYIYSPDNIQQICRSQHDEKTRAGDEPLPSREEMIDSLKLQIKAGKLVVSRAVKIRLMKGKI